ncbi:ExbD/TolR family protein [Agarilytica rhodophyticola]|uniref:ExbD/TolR family protein n=1 Tax=Agarilytica rhodophyticola TaxID=1737490 RepID=UPI001FE60BE3|nr:biopolymer transporter ExbD [Agarilytica rhodophyticola]
MKEQSRRVRRMERHHKLAKQSPLNLVSLMDIFTILVFFLLVNSSNTQQLPSNKDLTLPTSIAKKAPAETLVIAITKTNILVQGRKVADLSALADNGQDDIPALKTELDFLSANSLQGNESGAGRNITIMGDENTSYDIVRKILTTCQQANYTNIAFAATQVVNKVN